MDVESINENVIDTPWFRKLIKHRMEAKIYGHSLCELKMERGVISDVLLSNRLNVVPERGYLAMEYMNLEGPGIAYRHDKYWKKYLLEFGEEKDLGKLMTAAQYIIYKRGGIGDYAQCVELFGMPFREAKYNPFNPGDREKLDEAMKKAGAAGYAVIPDGAEITFHNMNIGTGGKDLYMGLIKEVCNEEMSKLFLGNTLTTSQGANGARSLGEVHKDGEDDLMLSHRIETEFDLNWKVKKTLQEHHVPELANGKFMFQESSELSIEKRIDIDVKLWNTGAVDFPENYWYETYGIPKPDKAQTKGAGGSGDNKGGEPAKEPSKNDDDEADTKLKIAAHATGSEVTCCADPRYDNLVVAAYSPDQAEEEFLKALFDGDGKKYDHATFQKNATKLVAGLKEGLAPSMQFGEVDTVAHTMMEMNLYRFSFNKNLAQVLELNQAVKDSLHFEDFRAKASNILGKFNENYLRTEFNMTSAVGQNARDYFRILETQNQFPYVRYRTVGDDNVRQSHAALDGRIFRVADGSWRSFVPPNGYNCRCALESVAELGENDTVSTGAQAGKSMGAEFNQMRKEGFNVNRADLGIVFDLNKEYADSLRGVSKDLNRVGYADAGLPSFKEIAKTKTAKVPLNTDAEPSSILQAFEQTATGVGKNRKNVIIDYANRPIAFYKHEAARHLKGKYINNSEVRHQLYDLIPDALTKPDEVYLNNPSSKVYNIWYVQHYSDKMFVVKTKVENGMQEIKTWHTDATGRDELVRKGILIKRKSN